MSAEPLSCLTCGDVAIVVRVLALQGANALVELDGAREEVALELVSGVRVGDRLLCHAGVALARVEAERA